MWITAVEPNAVINPNPNTIPYLCSTIYPLYFMFYLSQLTEAVQLNMFHIFMFSCWLCNIMLSVTVLYIISDYLAGLFCYKTLPVQCIIFADGSWPGFSA